MVVVVDLEPAVVDLLVAGLVVVAIVEVVVVVGVVVLVVELELFVSAETITRKYNLFS